MTFNVYKSTPEQLFQLSKKPEFIKEFLRLNDVEKKTCIAKIKEWESVKDHIPPTPKELISNVGNALVGWAKDGFKLSEKELYANRMVVCRECPFWKEMSGPLIGKCEKCGCYGAKQKIRASKCPLGKW